ncbi:MAG TPA: nucleotidyltransferase family protein [Bacillota bacterium]|nr:nucleotidyltransferase family protein [Bacillota bacterium]
MKDWRKTLISPETSILQALRVIEENALQLALVVGDNCQLYGTVTDGDVRRAILSHINLEEKVHLIMNPNPIIAKPGDDLDQILNLMKLKQIRHVPVVDEDGILINVELLDNLISPQERDNIVVLMAGGLGSRLRPLTDSCPKPLLKVGNKPLLETIIENIRGYGFHKFYLSVNYKADMIEDYFGNGSNWGVDISYLHEDTKLGTAGPLGLLPEKPDKPLLVMNGDLLTKVNFQQLLEFHRAHQSAATMCVRSYDFQVPYGVAEISDNRLVGIKEKPVQRFFVNAGIYVLEPEALEQIGPNEVIDMPSLFERLIEAGQVTSAFPIREYWLDIGQINDFERANGEYEAHFEADMQKRSWTR